MLRIPGLNCTIYGECGRETTKIVPTVWNGLRRMAGVICDRRVPSRGKGKAYNVAVRPAMETVTLDKRQDADMELAELKCYDFC